MPLVMFLFTAIVAFVIRFEIEVPYKLICRWDVSLPLFRKCLGMSWHAWYVLAMNSADIYTDWAVLAKNYLL